jgi:hypothetical protein
MLTAKRAGARVAWALRRSSVRASATRRLRQAQPERIGVLKQTTRKLLAQTWRSLQQLRYLRFPKLRHRRSAMTRS